MKSALNCPVVSSLGPQCTSALMTTYTTRTTMHAEFASFVQQGWLSDATITIGHTQYPAHKIILSNRYHTYPHVHAHTHTHMRRQHKHARIHKRTLHVQYPHVCTRTHAHTCISTCTCLGHSSFESTSYNTLPAQVLL